MAKVDKLVLYTRPLCGDCQQAKAYLNDQQIAYEHKNVEEHQHIEAELVSLTGSKIVPALIFLKRNLFGKQKVENTFIGFENNKQAMEPLFLQLKKHY